MDTYDATSIRLQLLANGYSPIPNLDKRCMLKGWASKEFAESLTPDIITSWKKQHRGFKATGLLVRDGLMPIDLDISDEAMVDMVMDKLRDIATYVHGTGPWRTGKYPKLMVLARWQASTKYPDKFGRIASDKFIDEAGKSHQIEIFGGARSHSGGSSKQVGAFGPHSEGIEYSWEDDFSPLKMPLSELPTMTQDQGWQLLAAFEELAKAHGWRQQELPHKGAAAKFNYDITPETLFEPEHGGDRVSFYDLEEGTRVSGSFIDGSSARLDKCSVLYCKARGSLGVFDHENDAWHLPTEAAPPTVDDQAEAFQEALAKLPRRPTNQRAAPAKPSASDSLAAQAHWLLQTYAYCPPNHSVVELFQPSDACEMRPVAFQTKYLAWREDSLGPMGGKHTALASAAWLIHADRITIRGIRMRPDQDYPLYEEDGEWFKNTYLRPIHGGEGEAATFLAFLEHLLPIAEEREWFLSWMAHKHRRPDIPGVAIVMVAAGPDGPVYGAGRGMLRDVLAKLLGPRYVRAIDFDVFSGRSAQGVYTDWGAYATLVTVSESKDTVDSGKWVAQRAVYERLKEIVDPRPVQRTFMRKGLPAFESPAFASYLVFSNNRDALQIPADDRRVTALQNGERLAPAAAMALQAWMDQPGNIAALARFLEARDLSQFDVYTPLRTTTKEVMQELARSELDDAYEMVRRRIGPSRLFTGEQVRIAVVGEMGDVLGSDVIRQQLTRKLRADATQVGTCRTTLATGRHKILRWRDFRGSQGGEMEHAEAQKHIQATQKVLDDFSSVVVPGPGPGSGPGEKEEGAQ